MLPNQGFQPEVPIGRANPPHVERDVGVEGRREGRQRVVVLLVVRMGGIVDEDAQVALLRGDPGGRGA